MTPRWFHIRLEYKSGGDQLSSLGKIVLRRMPIFKASGVHTIELSIPVYMYTYFSNLLDKHKFDQLKFSIKIWEWDEVRDQDAEFIGERELTLIKIKTPQYGNYKGLIDGCKLSFVNTTIFEMWRKVYNKLKENVTALDMIKDFESFLKQEYPQKFKKIERFFKPSYLNKFKYEHILVRTPNQIIVPYIIQQYYKVFDSFAVYYYDDFDIYFKDQESKQDRITIHHWHLYEEDPFPKKDLSEAPELYIVGNVLETIPMQSFYFQDNYFNLYKENPVFVTRRPNFIYYIQDPDYEFKRRFDVVGYSPD